MRFVAETLVIVGALLLVSALVPANTLAASLPDGAARSRWRGVQGAILVFLCAYCAYLVIFWARHETWADLIVPVSFFATAVLISVIVHAVVQTVDAVRVSAKPEREGVTDALVGVYNRRYLEHRLSEEVARARRHAVPVSVLLFDIDHFRRVNEKWGRDVGDRVLHYLGNLLLAGARESDVVARYGGEEILVIAPGTTAAQAAALADRLRVAVENENLAFGGESGSDPDVLVTVSVGVGELDPGETEWEPMVARANAAVLRAKEGGRNRVSL